VSHAKCVGHVTRNLQKISLRTDTLLRRTLLILLCALGTWVPDGTRQTFTVASDISAIVSPWHKGLYHGIEVSAICL